MNKFRKLRNEELNRLTTETYKEAEKSPIVIVLDNVRSQNNIGSVFRTADAFRVEKIYLCGITATPPNREIHKTALGAEDSVEWGYQENTITLVKRLKAENYLVYAVEQAENSISLEDFSLEQGKKYAFIFGNEVKGVQQEVINLADGCIEIPQFGTKHSFNISVTAGMVMWQIFNPLLKIWKGEK
ncbi:MAG: RNA methyltransferase [Odoribacter sp.]|nr:RNA methyltransferase [Odoribacter sp.]